MANRVPWSDLNEREKRNFQTLLHDHGIKVPLEECERYYGNGELIEQEATKDPDMGENPRCGNCFGPISQAGLLIEDTPGHCPNCGEPVLDASPERVREIIETVKIDLTPGEMMASEKAAELLEMTHHEFLRDCIKTRLDVIEDAIGHLEREQIAKEKGMAKAPNVYQCPECGEIDNPIMGAADAGPDDFKCPHCGHIAGDVEFEWVTGDTNLT